jgi:rod shape-determining protein MreC
VLGVLVVVSLVLITAYFRESDGGGLHGAQGTGASILRPFEVAADRIARPFRDAYGYFSSLFHARSEVSRLRREVQAYRQQASQAALLAEQNRQLRQVAHYVSRPAFPVGYKPLATTIISQAPNAYDQGVVIDAGVNNGVRKGDAVVTPTGLVGIVSLAYSRTARVTLLTDESAAVSGADQRTGARGVVRHTGGSGGSFVLDEVVKSDRVRRGDRVVTAGWRLGKLTPLYPKGLRIGAVTNVSERDTDPFKHVQVEPYVDFSKLETVVVLLERKHAK